MNILSTPVLAAADDTWGMAGPTFLRVYLAAAILVVTAGAIHRRRVLGGQMAPSVDQISPVQAAYLNGGRDLAVYAAIGWLRSAAAIGVSRRHRLIATGPPPVGASDLERAVHSAVGNPSTLADLHRDSRVRSALDSLSRGLEQAGLAIGPAQRHSARLGAKALLILLLIGAARLVTGLANGRPVGYLFLVLGAVLVAWFLLRRVPYQTRAATKALAELRQRHAHLAPAQSPAYATYGAAGAAMGVALFGAASLWALDPAFAQQAEIQRQAAASASSSAGATGTGCGGGGGDGGGGGCGGGCGGCGG